MQHYFLPSLLHFFLNSSPLWLKTDETFKLRKFYSIKESFSLITSHLVSRAPLMTHNACRSLLPRFSVRCYDCAGRSKFRWMAENDIVCKVCGKTSVNCFHYQHGFSFWSKGKSRLVSELSLCGIFVGILPALGRNYKIEDDFSLHGRLDRGNIWMASWFQISRVEASFDCDCPTWKRKCRSCSKNLSRITKNKLKAINDHQSCWIKVLYGFVLASVTFLNLDHSIAYFCQKA